MATVLLTDQTITVYRQEQVILSFSMSPAKDITGWTLVFTVARARNSPSKLIAAVTPTITNAATGLFRVDLAEEQTDIIPGTYFWDVWRTDEGLEQPLGLGPFVVTGVARVP